LGLSLYSAESCFIEIGLIGSESMPNILLTNKCNRACAYCFARDKVFDEKPQADLTFDDLIYVADFLERSSHKQLGLLGGEPTKHPQFILYLKYLLSRDFNLCVFTNGIVEEDLAREMNSILDAAHTGSVNVTVNINEEKYRSESEKELQSNFFQVMGQNAMLGFNIFEKDFSPDFLIETINRHNLRRQIRLGIASPITLEKNSFASTDDYPKVYRTIFRLAELCNSEDITLQPDCGFLLCGFSDEEIGKLFKYDVGLKFYCQVPLDIGPDLTTWRCFPLSKHHNKSLKDFTDLKEAMQYYDKAFDWAKKVGVFSECTDCVHLKKGRCAGGCIGHFIDSNSEMSGVVNV
jgi:organic radical activating enzyme